MKCGKDALVSMVVAVMLGLAPLPVEARSTSERPILGSAEEISKIRTLRSAARGATTVSQKREAITTIKQFLEDDSLEVSREAVLALEGLRIPEAETLLREVGETNASQYVRLAAVWALWRIKLSEAETHGQQIAVLMKALQRKKADIPPGDVRAWAIDELAERGVPEAIPEIEKAVRDMWGSSEYANARIEEAVAKIQLVAGCETRLEAYRKGFHSSHRKIVEWSILGLGDTKVEKQQVIDLLNGGTGGREAGEG